MVPISDSFIQGIKSLHKEFMWSNRKPKIKHTVLIGDYAEGGLKDIDIEYNNNVHFEGVRFICGPHLAIIGPSEARADLMAR